MDSNSPPRKEAGPSQKGFVGIREGREQRAGRAREGSLAQERLPLPPKGI